MLHTWSRELSYHPHIHAIVTAGGLRLDGSAWQPSGRYYLFPAKQVMSVVFRGKMMETLRKLEADGVFAGFDDFDDPEGFERLMTQLAATSWVVYAKKPFDDVSHVIAYLGRYTHRVAISNSRFVEVTDRAVTFRTKDGKTITLTPVEFLRRFVQHVLPEGFHKIRHYGLYSGTHAAPAGLLEQVRNMLTANAPASIGGSPTPLSWIERLYELTGRDVTRCPICGGELVCLPLPEPSSRAPPSRLAA